MVLQGFTLLQGLLLRQANGVQDVSEVDILMKYDDKIVVSIL